MAGLRQADAAPLDPVEYLAIRRGPDVALRFGIDVSTTWRHHGATILGRLDPDDSITRNRLLADYGTPPGWPTCRPDFTCGTRSGACSSTRLA